MLMVIEKWKDEKYELEKCWVNRFLNIPQFCNVYIPNNQQGYFCNQQNERLWQNILLL